MVGGVFFIIIIKNPVPVLLFIKQSLLVVNGIGWVLVQWTSISQLSVIYVTVLHFVVDLGLGSVCLLW